MNRLLCLAFVVMSLLPCAGQSASPAADPLPQIVQMLAGTEDTQLQLDILRGLAGAARGQRSLAMPKGWDAVETKLSANADPQIRALVQSLSLTFGSQRALATLKQTLADSSAELNARRAALESLLATRDPSLPPLLHSLLKDAGLRSQAIRALGSYDDSKTPEALLSAFGSLNASDQRDALNTLASRVVFAKPLMAALASGHVPRSALTADLIRQLRNLKSEEVNQSLTKVYGTIRESSADKQKEIERYKQVYRAGGSQPGEASRGRAVFNKVCVQCHTLFDEGGKVGPDITGANRTDLDYLLQNMVDPNAVIPNEYRSTSVETKDGRNVLGILKQQDDKSVTIQTQNETLILQRPEVASIVLSELSMMPEGLLAPLSDQEARDLIYYLGRPGQVPLPAERADKPN